MWVVIVAAFSTCELGLWSKHIHCRAVMALKCFKFVTNELIYKGSETYPYTAFAQSKIILGLKPPLPGDTFH